MTDPVPQSRAKRPRWMTGLALAAAFVAGGVVTGGLAVAAPGMAMHHMMHGRGGPEHMHAMAAAHVNKMLDEVGASADQKTKIQAILRDGFAPMDGLHDQMRQTHQAFHTIMAAPTIDRAALEQLRAGDMAKLDAASRGMTKALADAAEVLTPEQRAKLVDRMTPPPRPM